MKKKCNYDYYLSSSITTNHYEDELLNSILHNVIPDEIRICYPKNYHSPITPVLIPSTLMKVDIINNINNSDNFMVDMRDPSTKVLWELGYWLGLNGVYGLDNLIVIEDTYDLLNKFLEYNPSLKGLIYDANNESDELFILDCDERLEEFFSIDLSTNRIAISINDHTPLLKITLGYLIGNGIPRFSLFGYSSNDDHPLIRTSVSDNLDNFNNPKFRFNTNFK